MELLVFGGNLALLVGIYFLFMWMLDNRSPEAIEAEKREFLKHIGLID